MAIKKAGLEVFLDAICEVENWMVHLRSADKKDIGMKQDLQESLCTALDLLDLQFRVRQIDNLGLEDQELIDLCGQIGCIHTRVFDAWSHEFMNFLEGQLLSELNGRAIFTKEQLIEFIQQIIDQCPEEKWEIGTCPDCSVLAVFNAEYKRQQATKKNLQNLMRNVSRGGIIFGITPPPQVEPSDENN